MTIFECRTKATAREGDRLRFSLNWAFARRSKLILTDREFRCGDWCIPYCEVEDAVLVEVPTRFGPACNLMLKWQGVTYQFQLKSESLWRIVNHPFWDGPLPLPVRREVRHFPWR